MVLQHKYELEPNQYYEWTDEGVPILIEVNVVTGEKSVVICCGAQAEKIYPSPPYSPHAPCAIFEVCFLCTGLCGKTEIIYFIVYSTYIYFLQASQDQYLD